jgi:allantoin racemase
MALWLKGSNWNRRQSMRIFIINPNSDPRMTALIQQSAEDYASDRFEVVCRPTPGAPLFIETYEDMLQAAPGMIQLLRENEEEFDAFVIACHSDPNLDAMKEITTKPVVGIGEASMKLASMLGHSFSVVTTMSHSIPNKEAQVKKLFLQDVLASVRAAPEGMAGASDEEKYLCAAQMALEEDMAEVIVLGCAGMAGLDRRLTEKLGAPVLDGVVCALIIATGLAQRGISTSKVRRYNPKY